MIGVTGGRGFVGSHIVNRLLYYEWDVPVFIMGHSGIQWQDWNVYPDCFPPPGQPNCPS